MLLKFIWHYLCYPYFRIYILVRAGSTHSRSQWHTLICHAKPTLWSRSIEHDPNGLSQVVQWRHEGSWWYRECFDVSFLELVVQLSNCRRAAIDLTRERYVQFFPLRCKGCHIPFSTKHVSFNSEWKNYYISLALGHEETILPPPNRHYPRSC